jgi:hypothetical protein
VLSSDASLLDDVREFRWKRLFVERRANVIATMRVHVFGHALLDKALRPYVGMSAHAILLQVPEEHFVQQRMTQLDTIDMLAADAVRSLTTPRSLSPLPVLGIPGWWRENEEPAFYDNAAYFREGRKPRVARPSPRT